VNEADYSSDVHRVSCCERAEFAAPFVFKSAERSGEGMSTVHRPGDEP
jgi:hypothetical protein